MGIQKRLVQGVGINDGECVVKVENNGRTGRCPFYRAWCDMLRRCYSPTYLKKRPTYKDCKVCDEWLLFSNFKKWMEQQDWQGKHLDKDILITGNKVYSPETCAFVDNMTNNFVAEVKIKQSEYLTGVTFGNNKSKFRAKCSNPLKRRESIECSHEHLGYFDNEMDAHLAWKKRKHEIACRLADEQSDPRVAEALKKRYL